MDAREFGLSLIDRGFMKTGEGACAKVFVKGRVAVKVCKSHRSGNRAWLAYAAWCLTARKSLKHLPRIFSIKHVIDANGVKWHYAVMEAYSRFQESDKQDLRVALYTSDFDSAMHGADTLSNEAVEKWPALKETLEAIGNEFLRGSNGFLDDCHNDNVMIDRHGSPVIIDPIHAHA